MNRMLWSGIAGAWLLAAGAEAGVVRGRLNLPQVPASANAGRGAVRGPTSGPEEAIVYVDSLPEKLLRRYSPRKATVRVIQDHRRFEPRVLAVAAGTSVRFQNRDDVYHNVFSVSPAKRFDLGKYPPGTVNQVTFDRPGIVNLYCDIHPGMAAYVVVLPHRCYARPDRSGAFALPKLPAGKYWLCAWHPAHGEIRREVVVPPRGDVSVSIGF